MVDCKACFQGETSLDDWRNEIRAYPAPWTEFEVPDQLIFTFQSSYIRDYDDPEDFLLEYEKVMTRINHLSGFDDNYRYRGERLALDVQIGGGKDFVSMFGVSHEHLLIQDGCTLAIQ